MPQNSQSWSNQNPKHPYKHLDDLLVGGGGLGLVSMGDFAELGAPSFEDPRQNKSQGLGGCFGLAPMLLPPGISLTAISGDGIDPLGQNLK